MALVTLVESRTDSARLTSADGDRQRRTQNAPGYGRPREGVFLEDSVNSRSGCLPARSDTKDLSCSTKIPRGFTAFAVPSTHQTRAVAFSAAPTNLTKMGTSGARLPCLGPVVITRERAPGGSYPSSYVCAACHVFPLVHLSPRAFPCSSPVPCWGSSRSLTKWRREASTASILGKYQGRLAVEFPNGDACMVICDRK